MKQNTILLVGALSEKPDVYTYATSFVTALKTIGFTVQAFNYRKNHAPLFLQPLNTYKTNQKLIETVKKLQPSIVFLIKAETIFSQTIQTIKKNFGCTIIYFHPDNPFVLWNGNSTANVLKSLPLFDCFLCWSQLLMPVLETAGCNHCCYFPFAYDESLFTKNITITEQDYKKYEADVCFVGTWEPVREQWIYDIQAALPEISIAIWGNDWDKQCQYESVKKVVRGAAIYKDEMIKAFRCSKIVLNFIREQNMTSHNMRTFEVPASNGFLLTQRTVEQTHVLFTEGENIACFQGTKELIEKISYYLAHPDARQEQIKKGFKHVQQFTLTKQLRNYFESCPIMKKNIRAGRSPGSGPGQALLQPPYCTEQPS